MKRRLAESDDDVRTAKRADYSSDYSPDDSETDTNGNPPPAVPARPDPRRLDSNSDVTSESESESETPNGLWDTEPAKSGWIQKLELFNFMCHDHFVINLHPQINFIIGRNGAGKSAILTGLLVAFGVRANDTSRGSAAKDLIKHGKQTAKVRVTFANEGVEAYQPDVYGPSITIERKLVQKGAHSYSLLDSSGKVVSKRRRDLDDMLRRFGITAENPMAFMSQERAKQFLKDTNDSQKFDYFRQGAMIDVIEKNYVDSEEKLINIRRRITQAQESMKSINSRYQKLEKEHNSYSDHQTLQAELAALQGRVLWEIVRKIELKIDAFVEKETACQEDITSLEGELEKLETEMAAHDVRKRELQDVVEEALAIRDHNRLEAEKAKDFTSGLNQKLNAEKAQLSELENKIIKCQNDIKTLEGRLEGERERLEQSGNSRDIIEKELHIVEEQLSQVILDFNAAQAAVDEAAELQLPANLGDELRSASDEVDRLSRHVSQQNRDPYQAWGSGMRNLVAAIKREQGWKNEPIGPLGAFISVRSIPGFKNTEWQKLVCTVLAKQLNSFVVSCESDRRRLEGLISRYIQHNGPSVITRKFAVFDFSQGKPRDCNTLVDILDVSDPIVQCALVDSSQVERYAILTQDDQQAINLAGRSQIAGVYILRGNGGKVLKSVNRTLKRDPIYFDEGLPRLAVKNEDFTEQLREAQNHLAELRNREREEREKIRRRKEQALSARRECQEEKAKLETKIFALREKLAEDLQAQVDNLQNALQHEFRRLESHQRLRESLTEQVAAISAQHQSAKETTEKLKQAFAAANYRLDMAKEEVRTFDVNNAASEHRVAQLKSDIDDRQQELEKIRQYLEEGRTKREARVSQAEEIVSREQSGLQPTDTKESLARRYEELDLKVKQLASEQRRSYEECLQEFLNVQQEREEGKRTLEEMAELHGQLRQDLNHRQEKFIDARTRKQREARQAFSRCLGIRGFDGSLCFDEDRRRLSISVSRERDGDMREVSTLSGGEKSYTQISFLLAIWRIMESKIRGLDEFDVFMDSVNRSIAIKMLLQELEKYPKSQTILVTPQDISAVGDLDRDDVKIHRMNDPRA
ncbi:hypothetical protein DIURU_002957 [Diutina rugosa]|uniref:RecF/RecN/SMC N-terminal domain-containing protein n=1 Tax=Diutina rugosa TaxID=5481 RepID=A0A642UN73_DIURU|nr:uncharacterized protein DIURU_002957 [Diutina rugosa]KAA8902163.1 hypothetical protein DIURU_002957 [Diutina rugosa]